MTRPLEERFWEKVVKTDTCWLWMAGKASGYGRIRIGNAKESVINAHRLSVMLSGRTIPIDMCVDHICMNRSCVNPEHLRVVTQSVNAVENSNSPAALNKRRTICVKGHPFTLENTIIEKNSSRRCRICKSAKAKRHWAKHGARHIQKRKEYFKLYQQKIKDARKCRS